VKGLVSYPTGVSSNLTAERAPARATLIWFEVTTSTAGEVIVLAHFLAASSHLREP